MKISKDVSTNRISDVVMAFVTAIAMGMSYHGVNIDPSVDPQTFIDGVMNAQWFIVMGVLFKVGNSAIKIYKTYKSETLPFWGFLRSQNFIVSIASAVGGLIFLIFKIDLSPEIIMSILSAILSINVFNTTAKTLKKDEVEVSVKKSVKRPVTIAERKSKKS